MRQVQGEARKSGQQGKVRISQVQGWAQAYLQGKNLNINAAPSKAGEAPVKAPHSSFSYLICFSGSLIPGCMAVPHQGGP